uniref:Membrane magnesium transporter n=1 Tax=Pinguiococcus pyrenoidosus TaxID=172671 RepID=A0A7R9YCH6_9STRA|mmetsp:Transcript_18249/g.69186  ORF Transcript_18249/g.69186 Transcript_18249/m.69186 type:complete len:120 (+) Transcript_18249:87-446(+)
MVVSAVRSVGRGVTGLGMIVLMHAAYSAAQYIKLARASSSLTEGLMGPPQDVVIEVGLSFGLCLIGTLLSLRKLRPVKRIGARQQKDIDTIFNRPEFVSLNTRNAALARRRARLLGKKS